jgi:hypothetical protein
VRAQWRILAVEVARFSSFQDQLLTLKADLNCDFGGQDSALGLSRCIKKAEKTNISQPCRARTVANFSCRGSWAQQVSGSAPNSPGGFELRFWWSRFGPRSVSVVSKKQKKQTFPSLAVRAQWRILAVEVAGLSSCQDQILTLKTVLNCDFGGQDSALGLSRCIKKAEKTNISQPCRARTVANFSCRGSWAQ